MKLEFVGDCTEILEEGGTWEGADDTELAQMVEKGEQITKEEFKQLTDIDSLRQLKILDNPGIEFWYNKDEGVGVAWIYDPNKDIHYFYAG